MAGDYIVVMAYGCHSRKFCRMLAAAVLMANVNAMTSASAYDVIDQARMIV